MSRGRRDLIKGILCASLAAEVGAQTPPPRALQRPETVGLPDPSETVDLWPDMAPGGLAPSRPEVVEQRSRDPLLSDRAVRDITVPRLVVFRPLQANGAAILIAPGGAYRQVVVDKEGYEFARWIAARGVTAFVLFYRLPAEGWSAGPDVSLADAQRAMRVIRHRAGEFGIDPRRVAALGFSAGGHLCADLLTRHAHTTYEMTDAADSLSARPDLAALLYPVISMSPPDAHAGSREQLLGAAPSLEQQRAHSPHLLVPADAPPGFLLHAVDDMVVPVGNTHLMYAALRARQIPAELHLFEQGGHGFGLQRATGLPVAIWPELFLQWAMTHHWIPL